MVYTGRFDQECHAELVGWARRESEAAVLAVTDLMCVLNEWASSGLMPFEVLKHAVPPSHALYGLAFEEGDLVCWCQCMAGELKALAAGSLEDDQANGSVLHKALLRM
jgi:hypothetical protein